MGRKQAKIMPTKVRKSKDTITVSQVELIRQAVIRQLGGRATQDKKHAFGLARTKPQPQ